MTTQHHPTDAEIRAEAIRRVDNRHAGCVISQHEREDEIERETLHVASLARQYPWEQVVTVPPMVAEIEEMGATIARLQKQDEEGRSAGYETLIRAASRQRGVDAEDAAFVDELDAALGEGRR